MVKGQARLGLFHPAQVKLPCVCFRCNGSGKDPKWSASNGEPEPCDDCGGSGQVVQ